MVECTTDNRNRTVSEVRHAFTKNGGSLAAEGSVAYLFDRVGFLTFPQGTNEEAVMEIAVAADADEVEVTDEGIVEVTTAPEVFDAVHDALKSAGLTVEFAEILQRPSSQAVLDDENSEKVMGLIDALDELDDVQEVFTNASLAGDLLSEE